MDKVAIMGLFRNLFRWFRDKPSPAQVVQRRIGEEKKKPPALLTPEEREALLAGATPEEMRYFDFQSVSSSWIDALRFNPLIPNAQMRLKHGSRSLANPSGVYTFGGMTFDTFIVWYQAGSKGKFFNANLLGRYTEWAGFPSVGRGGRAERERAGGRSVWDELGIPPIVAGR